MKHLLLTLPLLLLIGCGDNVIDPLPACAELGCPGLEGTCKPGHCACAPGREDAPVACVTYPACAELECRALACEGNLCTCELAAGFATCETP